MEEETLSPEEQELKAMDEKLSKELSAETGEQPEEANNTETPEEPEEKEEETAEKKEDEVEEEVEEDVSDEEQHRQPLIPYRKFKEERDKRKNLEGEISSLKADIESIKQSGKSQDEQQDDIDKLAEENGVDPNFLKKFADSITSKIKSPISEEELSEWREQREIKKQQDLFSDEFEDLLKEKPDAQNHRAELKDLAFSTKYAGKNFKSLFEIYVREIEPNTSKKKTIESTSKKSDTVVVDYENMEESEALKLSPEKFLEWTDYKATH